MSGSHGGNPVLDLNVYAEGKYCICKGTSILSVCLFVCFSGTFDLSHVNLNGTALIQWWIQCPMPPPPRPMKKDHTSGCRIDSIFLVPTHTTSGSTTVSSSVCVTHDRNANVKVRVNIRRVNGSRVLWATLTTCELCDFLDFF